MTTEKLASTLFGGLVNPPIPEETDAFVETSSAASTSLTSTTKSTVRRIEFYNEEYAPRSVVFSDSHRRIEFFEITDWSTLDYGHTVDKYRPPEYVGNWGTLAVCRLIQVWGKCSIDLIRRGFGTREITTPFYAGVIGSLNSKGCIERNMDGEWVGATGKKLFQAQKNASLKKRAPINIDAVRNHARRLAEVLP